MSPEVTARPGYRPFCPPEPAYRSAVHEAGHAIVARLQGIRVDTIKINPRGGRTELLEPGDSAGAQRRHGITLAAGEMAARVFGADRKDAARGAAGDRAALAKILGKLGPGADRAAMYDEALSLVDDNRAAIAALANSLHTHRRLAGVDAEDAINAALAGERFVILDDSVRFIRRRELFEQAIKGYDLDANPRVADRLWNRAGWVALRGGPMPDAATLAAELAGAIAPEPA